MAFIITGPPTINGHQYAYSSIKFNAVGLRFFDLKAISYKSSLKPGKVRGMSAAVRGRTRGLWDGEASFDMYKAESQRLIQVLGPNFMEVAFDVSVTYAEANSPTITDILSGLRITDLDNSHSEDAEGLITKVSLDVFRMKLNGFSPVSDPVFL